MFPEIIKEIVNDTRFKESDVGRSSDTVYVFENKYILKVSENNEMLAREKQGFDFLCEKGIDASRSILFTEENGKYYYLRTYLEGDSLISERFLKNPNLLSDVLCEVIGVLRSPILGSCPFNSTDNVGCDFVHGDLCLPNIYVTGDNHFAGFIDVGNCGLGDRWYDYTWLLWSMEYNLGTDKYGKELFARLGICYDNDKFCKYIPDDMRGMRL